MHFPRRAQCHLQMLKPQLAIGDFKKVLALEPNNQTVKTQLEATQKLVRKIEFEKVNCFHCEVPNPVLISPTQAIEMEEETNAVQRCLEIIAEGTSSHTHLE